MQRYTLFTRTGPPDSSAALFTADGELLEPGMRPLEGPEAIRAFLAPLWQMVTVRKAVTTTDAIEVHGDVAYQWAPMTRWSRCGISPRPTTTGA